MISFSQNTSAKGETALDEHVEMNTVQEMQTPPVMQAEPEKRENVLGGIVGAFLFSLAGGVIWFLLDMVGFYAGISGLIGAVCAIQGYRIFGGRLSKKGVIIAAVISLLVLALAWYLCFAKDLFQAHKEWYAAKEIDYMPTYAECVRAGGLWLKEEPEIARSYLLNLLVGIALAIVGSVRYIINAFKENT